MSKSIKLNAFFKAVLSIVNIIFPLLVGPYVARVLSVDGYTEYNKAISMMNWFNPFAIFGVYTYGMRTVSQIKNDKQKLSKLFTTLFSFNIFTSLFVTVIYLFLIFTIPSFSEYRMIYVLFSFQIFSVCFSTDYVNEAFETYGFILVKSFICRLLYVIAVFFFVKTSDDTHIYVLLGTLSVLANNILTFIYSKTKISFTKITIKDFISLIKPLFIVFLLVNSSMLFTIFDRFMLIWFGNKLNLTYYNISQTIILAVVNVTTSIILVSIPRLSYYWGNEKKEEYFELLTKSSATFLCIHTPCCIGIAALAFEVIFLYSGAKYIAATPTLFLFAIRYYISAFDMIFAKQVLLATGNEKKLTKIYYFTGLINIILKIILVIFNILTPQLCIITTLICDFLIIILQNITIKKLKLNIVLPIGKILKYFITSLIFIPIILLINHYFQSDNMLEIILRTIISIFSCTIIYAIMLFVSKDDFVQLLFRGLKK